MCRVCVLVFRIIAASFGSARAIGCYGFLVGFQRRRCRQTIADRAVPCDFAARLHSVLPPRSRCSRLRTTLRKGFGVEGRAVARTLNGHLSASAASGLQVGASDLLRIRAPRQISLPDRFLVYVSPKPPGFQRVPSPGVRGLSLTSFRFHPARGPFINRLSLAASKKRVAHAFPFDAAMVLCARSSVKNLVRAPWC